MAEPVLPGAIPALGADDIVLPFHVAPLDTRGRAIRLGSVLDSTLIRVPSSVFWRKPSRLRR